MRLTLTWKSLAASAATGMLLAACGSVTETSSAPVDAATLSAGEALYQASCAECHGADLRGTDRGPSHLSQVYEPSHHGDAAFLLAVQRGVPAHHWNFGSMPPIPGLGDDDVTAIVAYVRSEQQSQGFESYPP